MTMLQELPTEFHPRCAKCGMPVEEFGFELLRYSVIFVARCHGKDQMVFFTPEELDGIEGIELGQAFADPPR